MAESMRRTNRDVGRGMMLRAHILDHKHKAELENWKYV